jgi:glycosyltransferase involved in cell wall biosynthesis
VNIVHVPRRFVQSHWGGTETVIVETCKRLVRMGHETRIICPNALATRDREVLDGVDVLRVPYFYPYLGLKDEARQLMDRKGGNLFSFALMEALKNEPRLDLIHLHTAKRTGGIGRYVALKRGIPYVVSLHGGMFDVPTAEAATWTEPTQGALEWGKLLGWWVGSRRVMDDAAAIICVGEEEKIQTQHRYPAKKVVHLPNGVDPDRFAAGDGKGFRHAHGIPEDRFVLLTVGRIDPQKNQLLVLKLMPRLAEIHDRIHYLIIGPVTNEDYGAELDAYIQHHDLHQRVTVIRGLPADGQALTDAYHAADAFVLPSIHEPFGIVILEAWAAGLPVLASRVGGIPSFVVSGQDGYLFTSNDKRSLIDAFHVLVHHPEEARAWAESGKRKARNEYGWDTIVGRLVALYEEAIRENPLRQ